MESRTFLPSKTILFIFVVVFSYLKDAKADVEWCCSVSTCKNASCPLIMVTEESPVGQIIGNITLSLKNPTISITGDAFGSSLIKQTSRALGSTKTLVELSIKSRIDAEVTTKTFKANINFKTSDADFSENVEIRVLDINDNNPSFSLPVYRCDVFENTPSSVCDGIALSDRDSDVSTPSISLQGVDATSDFSIKVLNEHLFVPTWTRSQRPPLHWNLSVTMNKSVDYEKQRFFSLTLVARDSIGRNATAQLMITVKDRSDMPPVFTRISNDATIPENSLPGTFVIQMAAQDGDQGIRHPIRYALSPNNATRDYFAINATTGVVTLTKKIDRENPLFQRTSFVVIDVVATEQTTTSPAPNATAQVRVTISDANDYPPTFNRASYVFNVMEDTQRNIPLTVPANGTEIEVEDKDLGKNGEFNVSLVSGGVPFTVFRPSSTLVFNKATILLRVENSSALDYERVRSFSFQIVAVDQTPPYHSANASVFVQVTNINDNQPKFARHRYILHLAENAPVGTFVGQVLATDGDAGRYGNITYRLIGNAADVSKFHINNITGVITVAVAADSNPTLLDRESRPYYFVNLMAEDSGQLTAFTQLQITLDDRNDNAPRFERSLYTATLNEGSTSFLGSKLLVKATDADQGPNNNVITYSIVDGNNASHFAINATTGELRVVNPIDFEALPVGHSNGVFNLTIQATDGGLNGTELNSTTIVRVTVEDLNDQAPVFASNYSRQINESWPPGSIILQVNATDADQPGQPQSQIFYRIGSGGADMFAINSSTGVISVQTLTRLVVNRYQMTVLAVDRGSPAKTGSATVVIDVTDVNNKAPYFPAEVVRHPVEENATVGSVLYNFTARDPDTGAVLAYRIDQGRMSAKFGRQPVNASSFNFTKLFSIDSTGGVRLLGKLDREKADTITIPIIVNDTTTHSGIQTASGELILIIEDVNDEFPKFQHLNNSVYTLMVPESQRADEFTSLTVQATDGDDNDRITYSLIDPTNTFSVEASSGRVKLRRALNFEHTKGLNFTVRATDRAGHTTTAAVLVTVTDYNDNAPQFVNFTTPLHVSENASVGDVLMVLTATDNDTGAFGRIHFQLNSGGGGKFSVVDTPRNGEAQLKLAKTLDRDVSGGTQYSLIIGVTDNAGATPILRSTRVLQIIVDDVNDNTPVFSRPDYIVNTTETVGSGITLEVVSATDLDSGTNAQITYSLLGNSTAMALFGVTTVSKAGQWVGNIVTKKALEHAAGCYNLHVVATDKGSPALSSNSTLRICIQDVNDYSPVFVVPRFNTTAVYLNESDINVTLITVQARDNDPMGPNREVRYQLLSTNNDHLKFSLGVESGILQNLQKLDRENQSVYRLTVKAYDLGRPQRSAFVQINVEVLDEDDNQPAFPTPGFVQKFNISENAPTVSLPDGRTARFIGNVSQAKDRDHGAANKKICYFIVNIYYNFLYLNQHTGGLYSLKALDREQGTGMYEIVIKAVGSTFCSSTRYQWRPTSGARRRRLLYLDAASAIAYNPSDPTLSKVQIYITDANDNPPKFDATSYFFGVTQDSVPNTEIKNFKVLVTDKDTASVNNHRFAIDGPVSITPTLKTKLDAAKITTIFTLHPTTGILTTGPNVYFSNTMEGYFSFTVKVTDGGFSDTANCTVYLLNREQQIIAVFREGKVKVGDFSPGFVKFLSNITGLTVNKDSIQTHREATGMFNNGKTDMYLHAYNPTTKKILSSKELILKLDSVDQKSLTTLYNKYNVIEVKPAVSPVTAQSLESIFRIALVATACGLGMLLLVSCFCLWSCRRMYRRKLKAANVAAYGAANGTLGGVPGATVDTYDGSNPIWLENYDNWALHNNSSDKEFAEEGIVEEFNPYASGPSTNLDNTPPQEQRRLNNQPSSTTDSASGSNGLSNRIPLRASSSRSPPAHGVPTLLGIVSNPESVIQATAI